MDNATKQEVHRLRAALKKIAGPAGMPPCDCIKWPKKNSSRTSPEIDCECGNPEDRERVARWLERHLLAETVRQALANDPPEVPDYALYYTKMCAKLG